MKQFLLLIILLIVQVFSNQDLCLYLCDRTGGSCTDNICLCNPGYITFLSYKSRMYCNYEQKSRMKAGFLELILGNGIGHFYSGRSLNGLFKLSLTIFICFSCYISLFLIKKLEEDPRTAGHPHLSLLFIVTVSLVVIIVLWQILDGFLFFFGFYKDGNNLDLS